jgi:hypothetical protein
MGKLDILTKEYMKRPSIFADVFNQYIYKGCQVILPDRLVELDTTEIVIPYGGGQASVPVQKYRDVSKMLTAMTDGRAAYCILAVENEGKINYAMPVKNGLYDFINLAGQVTKSAVIHKASSDKSVKPTGDEFLSGFWKSDRLLPVMTVVVYFGSEMWDGPMCLSEMYTDCDAELLKYVADYRINLITPMNLTDHEIDGFQTGMREIMRYIKYSNDRKAIDSILKTDRRFKSVERRAVEIINAATNSKIKFEQGKETVDMCLAIQEMREESRNEGRIEGILAFIQDKVEDEVPENVIVAKLQKHFALDEETAKQYYLSCIK